MLENLFVYDDENKREGFVKKEGDDILITYGRYKTREDYKYNTGTVYIKLSKEEAKVLVDKLNNFINNENK